MLFPFLTQAEILEIHQATLRVLSEVGIILDEPEARSLLCDHGARDGKGRIRLPAELVETCLASCPAEAVLRGRGGEVRLGNNGLNVHNLGGARDVLDTPNGSLRPATAEDVAQSTRLLDGLENITTITPLYTPRDVPAHMMVLTMFDRTLRNTLKPVNGPGVRTRAEVVALFEMTQVVFGDRPSISMGASPVSPLNFQGEIAGVMLEIARRGFVFGPLPCPCVGATSPMSLAGSLVQQNAENLASIVLAQLTAPGLPVVYCGRLSALNMRSGAPIWGNPEVGMMSAATVQIGHHYQLPVNVYGLAGSGFAQDMQSGYERAINALVPALAGADELSGVGEMAGGVCSSNAQIVIDNDIYGMVRRVLHGFAINKDSLAVEVIGRVMDSNRNYLKEQHTRKYLRGGEIWQGRLGVQEVGWDLWREAGCPSVLERAQSEAKRILTQHEIPPLPEDRSRALDEIMQAALFAGT
ncbi:MAG TPA: trimethylamine methyltransferase family protein [Anaerolineales bacterium]